MPASQSMPEPLQATGPNSTSSSPKLTVAEKLRAAVPMLGLESVRRTNKTIDDASKRHMNANLSIYDDDDTNSSEGGEMDSGSPMILGDNIQHHYHGQQQKNGMGKLATGLAVAALLGGGGGAVLFLSQHLTPVAEKVVETVIEKQTDVWDFEIEMEVDRKP